MTTHIKHELRQIVAGADLSGTGAQFKVVTLDGVICSAALFNRAAGILFYGGVASSFLGVAYVGITKAYIGATCASIGFPLAIANSGFLVPVTSGGFAVGRLSDATAASGDLAQVSVDFTAPPTFIGL
jgi:hypothetical protein